jgi:hypothetical protein
LGDNVCQPTPCGTSDAIILTKLRAESAAILVKISEVIVEQKIQKLRCKLRFPSNNVLSNKNLRSKDRSKKEKAACGEHG